MNFKSRSIYHWLPRILTIGYVCSAAILASGQTSTPVVETEHTGDLETAFTAVRTTPPFPAAQLPAVGTFYSAQHPLDWPPLPSNPYGHSAWPLGDWIYLLDDTTYPYPQPTPASAPASLLQASGASTPQTMQFSSSDLWLTINGASQSATNWTAD